MTPVRPTAGAVGRGNALAPRVNSPRGSLAPRYNAGSDRTGLLAAYTLAATPPPLGHAVATVAGAETTWGTLYFSFPLFSGPMQRDLGWSAVTLNSALTCGLLVTALMAYPVGTRLDRGSGRALMTAGSLGAGCLLLAWSAIDAIVPFYLLWLALGVSLSCCLIEPLFAVVNQAFGADARRGITVVTMITGLAGTIYVPLIGELIRSLEWRETLLVLAALNLGFAARALAVHPVARAMRRAAPAAGQRGRVVMRRRLRNPVFWGLALWYTSYSLTGSSIIFQFVPLLRAERHRRCA